MSPNPSCFVCAEQEGEEEPDAFAASDDWEWQQDNRKEENYG